MARLPRLHVSGGVYSIVLRGNGGRPIFASDEDRAAFGKLVGQALARNEARAHAFCWMRNQASLAVQVDEEPVERFIRGVAGPYARRVHRQCGYRGHLFGERYIAVLIDDAKDLPALVRHIHWAPVRENLASSPAAYPWSSHLAYARSISVPWLTTTVVLRRLARGGVMPQIAYAEYMKTDNPPPVQRGFEQGSAGDPRAFGDEAFLGSLPRVRRQGQRLRTSLDDLIEATAEMFHVSTEEILSLSRRRHLALARAVITWHAVRHDIASLSEVSRRLRRDPSTLLSSIQRHRKASPDLFGQLITRAGPRDARSWNALVRS